MNVDKPLNKETNQLQYLEYNCKVSLNVEDGCKNKSIRITWSLIIMRWNWSLSLLEVAVIPGQMNRDMGEIKLSLSLIIGARGTRL